MRDKNVNVFAIFTRFPGKKHAFNQIKKLLGLKERMKYLGNSISYLAYFSKLTFKVK